MISSEQMAHVICNIDLDKDLLGWSNGEFYPVYMMGRLWRSMQKQVNCNGENDCNYVMVTEKVRDFLNRYEGEKKEEVIAQLKKLENRAQEESVKGLEQKKVAKGGKTESADEFLERQIFFTRLLTEFNILTQFIEDQYLPYLPMDARSCRCDWLYCPEKTNVKLGNFPDEKNGYIHANTVSMEKGLDFIATIYPLNRTKFWSMALEKGNVVVDLTNGNDLVRNQVNPYYPQNEGETYLFNKRMRVKCISKQYLNSTLITYALQITDVQTKVTKTIHRIHYTGWEDVCGTNESELLELIRAIEPYLGQEQVPIVHCMGGVGRTGTALTGIALKRLIDEKDLISSIHVIDHMRRFILEGRKQRGPEFVQTPTQLETLWALANQLISEKRTHH